MPPAVLAPMADPRRAWKPARTSMPGAWAGAPAIWGTGEMMSPCCGSAVGSLIGCYLRGTEQGCGQRTAGQQVQADVPDCQGDGHADESPDAVAELALALVVVHEATIPPGPGGIKATITT